MQSPDMVRPMVGQDDRKKDELIGAEENVFQKMLDQVTDFAMNLLNMKPKAGEAGGEAKTQANPTLDKAKEFASGAVKGMVDAGDNVIKSLKLDQNEMVTQLQKQAKDFLKQMGLLQEEFENEDYY